MIESGYKKTSRKLYQDLSGFDNDRQDASAAELKLSEPTTNIEAVQVTQIVQDADIIRTESFSQGVLGATLDVEEENPSVPKPLQAVEVTQFEPMLNTEVKSAAEHTESDTDKYTGNTSNVVALEEELRINTNLKDSSNIEAVKPITNAICEPCSHRSVNVSATNYCRECDEKYCLSCSFNHTAQKLTNTHTVVDIRDVAFKTASCNPCKKSTPGKSVDAFCICNDCKVYMCQDCLLIHLSQLENESHSVSILSDRALCEICKARDEIVKAVGYCLDCTYCELLCTSCVETHIAMKQTRSHKISFDLDSVTIRKDYRARVFGTPGKCNVTESNNVHGTDNLPSELSWDLADLHCEPCNFEGDARSASHYCTECDEKYCSDCKRQHSTHKSSSSHLLVDLKLLVPVKKVCEPCNNNEITSNASFYCQNCDEYLCDSCMKYHRSQKRNRAHHIDFFADKPQCAICASDSKFSLASAFCLVCDEPELLCQQCSQRHLSMKMTRGHRLSNNLIEFALRKLQHNDKLKFDDNSLPNADYTDYITPSLTVDFQFDDSPPTLKEDYQKREESRPGKPYVTENNKPTQLHLKWTEVKLKDNDAYQILYKEGVKGKWRTYRNTSVIPAINIDGLQPNRSYVFRIRVVNDISGDEGPFSEESEPLLTRESPALKMMERSTQIYKNPIAVYELPVKEIKSARNSDIKTRKMYLGRRGMNVREKTVMVVGATGSGKSTLINAMANYILGVTWEDSFRFTLVNIEHSEKELEGNQAHSQTQWITTYIVNSTVTSRINYTINLIDTPGFGDTRGLEYDKKIVDQIKEIFSARGNRGVATIDAVCFILKAPDARLTPTQIYIFESILSLFGNDIKDNICTLITFADGQRPPVLAAIESLEHKSLPYEKYFNFNNSALFARNNVSSDEESLSPTFWEMGMRSCKALFDHLDTLQTKSLQLTSEVLSQRELVELTVKHLQEEVDIGLYKINVLEIEIEIFTKFKRQIRENKDFYYHVTEPVQEKIDLRGKGIHTTNCLQCNFTCHEKCIYANDIDKIKCRAMRKGICTQCPSNCHWTQHHNTPYIIKWVNKRVKKKYSEKQKIYEEARQKSLTKEQVLEEMCKDIVYLECAITERMQEITYYNNKLKEIALRPDPLTVVQYLELMIESELREKKTGFQGRIDSLEKCKRRAQYGESVAIFQDRVRTSQQMLIASVGEEDATESLFKAVKKLGKKFINTLRL